MTDGYQPYPVGAFVREVQLKQEAKRHKQDATENRERVKLLEARLVVLERALARSHGRLGLEAVKATHPDLWPDDQQRHLDLSA